MSITWLSPDVDGQAILAVGAAVVEVRDSTQFFPTGRLCETRHLVQGKLAMTKMFLLKQVSTGMVEC